MFPNDIYGNLFIVEDFISQSDVIRESGPSRGRLLLFCITFI